MISSSAPANSSAGLKADVQNTLSDVVLSQITRARALIDTNPLSATYGTADRAYWYYRTLTNFPGSTWQQMMMAFATLLVTPDPANPYFNDNETLDLVGALLDGWRRSQQRDGSFDEWYLNEHSYCPTAITSAGAALTLHLVGERLPPAVREMNIAALERACTWLEPRYNATVMNQNLAAVVAFQGLARLQSSQRWQRIADDKLSQIGKDQSSEGWFSEYSGMDLGYSTLALDLLAAIHLLGGSVVAHGMAKRLSEFLARVQGRNIGLPGRLGSRGTSHTFPFGALYFSKDFPEAAALASNWMSTSERELTAVPASVDDRYFSYFYLPQFALAYWQAATSQSASQVQSVSPSDQSESNPSAELRLDDLPASGLVIMRGSGASLTVSRRLGGAVAFQAQDGGCVYHLGYEARTEDGKRFSTANWDAEKKLDGLAGRTDFEIAGQLRAVSAGLPLRRFMIPFQIVIHGLRSSYLAERFQGAIKHRLIAPPKALPLNYQRRITIRQQDVEVRDTLIPVASCPPLAALSTASTISMHSPSARQDRSVNIEGNSVLLEKACEALNRGSRVDLISRWHLGRQDAEIPVLKEMVAS